MSIENEIKKLTEAVVGLTHVLANAAMGGGPKTKPPVKNEAAKQAQETAPIKEEVEKVVEADQVAPGAGKAATAQVEEPVAEAPTSKYADAAKCTVDEIRARLTPVVQKHGPSAIEGPLKALGVEMLTKLPAEKYPELLEGVAAAIGEEV